MRKKLWAFPAVLLALLFFAGCGGGSNPSPLTMANSAPVSLTIRDNPPSGVDVRSFEITVLDARLQPHDPTKPAVILLSQPVQVELEHLQTLTAFLSTTGVPAGTTFDSITVTFANPEMTIFNGQSAVPIVVNGKACAPNQVCELQPSSLVNSSVTVSQPTPPFPLMLNAGSPMVLELDFDVQASIQNNSNLSINPTISLKAVTSPEPEGEMEDIDDLVGIVTAVGNNTFDLHDFTSGQDFKGIQVTGSTRFDFEGTCAANNFSCIQKNQILEVDLGVMGNGMFVAQEVELEGAVNELEGEGTVVKVDPTNNQFQVVIVDEEPAITNMAVGNVVTVTVLPNAQFQIDNDNLNLSALSGLSFASINDMVVGQNVEVRPAGPMPVAVDPNSGAITVTTDLVRLRMSQITATVNAVTAANNSFTIGTAANPLPSLFTNNGISQVLVQALMGQTVFENVTGISGLNPNDLVSVRGLLFKTATTPEVPELVAQQVRKR